LIFGAEDILVNNIAWFLRRFPLFPVGGVGDCAVQPVYVDDVAELAVAAAHQDGDIILDAVGPEAYTFNDMVQLIATKVRSRAKIVHVPPGVALFLSRLVGYILRDVVLTEDEMHSLMAGLLVSSGPPTAGTHLSRWLEENQHILGVRYASELRRHYS
jgi:NADH dehydrogenase